MDSIILSLIVLENCLASKNLDNFITSLAIWCYTLVDFNIHQKENLKLLQIILQVDFIYIPTYYFVFAVFKFIFPQLQ